MKLNVSPKRKKIIRTAAIVIAVLVVIRLVLPYVVLKYVNSSLASMNGYYGHVKDVDLSLYRGAYKIQDIYINKMDKHKKQSPFFASQLIDLSIEWKALLHGSVVGEIVFVRPTIVFTQNKVEPAQVQHDTTDFKKVLKDLMPLKVNRLEIQNGELRYKDYSASPNVDVRMNNLYAVAQNLRNSYDKGEQLPASVVANANVYGGTFHLSMKMNPLANQATYDLNAKMENTNLTQLNDFLKAYGGFDVHKGTFGLYTEMAAKNGRYKGYVKPVIKDLDVVGPEDKKDGFFNKLWENVVGAAGKVFKNQKKDQIATKIPLEGSTNNIKASTWYAIMDVLRNAFLQALTTSIENEINISSVGTDTKEHEGFFKKLFGSGDDKGKKEDKKDK